MMLYPVSAAISRYREDHRTIVPTPWESINELLQGGLGNGDFGLIFGNPGGGKSWSLVALGGFAVKLGYNVLHYTLELGSDYVGRRCPPAILCWCRDDKLHQ